MQEFLFPAYIEMDTPQCTPKRLAYWTLFAMPGIYAGKIDMFHLICDIFIDILQLPILLISI